MIPDTGQRGQIHRRAGFPPDEWRINWPQKTSGNRNHDHWSYKIGSDVEKAPRVQSGNAKHHGQRGDAGQGVGIRAGTQTGDVEKAAGDARQLDRNAGEWFFHVSVSSVLLTYNT